MTLHRSFKVLLFQNIYSKLNATNSTQRRFKLQCNSSNSVPLLILNVAIKYDSTQYEFKKKMKKITCTNAHAHDLVYNEPLICDSCEYLRTHHTKSFTFSLTYRLWHYNVKLIVILIELVGRYHVLMHQGKERSGHHEFGATVNV